MSAQPPASTEKTALLGGNEQGQPPVYSQPAQPPSAPPPYPDAPNSQKPPQFGTTATTVVVTQPVVTHPVVLRDFPVFIVDSQGRQVQTVLEYRTGTKTHLFCFLMFLIGMLVFWPALCFCWLPYILDSAKDVYHINPIDGSVVGVYKRM